MENIKILENKEFNGLEIYFDKRPSQKTITELKEHRFKWHTAKKCWYNKLTEQSQKFAYSLANTTELLQVTKSITANKKTTDKVKEDKAEQKILLDKYIKTLEQEQIWTDKSMLDYERKVTARIVELSNGNLLQIEKPRIKTDFCFGYSLSRYDTESYDNAQEMTQYASENQDYFINENLREFDRIADRLTAEKNYKPYLANHYTGSNQEDSKIKSINYITDYDYQFEMREEEKARYTPLMGEDLQKVIQAYKIERENFVKRLNTYLKKYGLSKINCWSYWRDE